MALQLRVGTYPQRYLEATTGAPRVASQRKQNKTKQNGFATLTRANWEYPECPGQRYMHAHECDLLRPNARPWFFHVQPLGVVLV